jgi:AcrR family transcriptional regulator
MASKSPIKAVPSTRREQYEWRREELLKAALRVFADRGIEGASLREVATEAGVVPGLLHHYFGGKERLMLEVIERYAFVPELDNILSETNRRSAAEVLTEIATRFNEVLSERANLMTLFFTGLANEQVRAGLDRHMDIAQERLADFLAERVANGELRPHNARAAAALLFSAISMGQLTGVAADPAVLVDLVMNGVASSAKPAERRAPRKK